MLPETPQEAEAQVAVLAERMATVFNSYLKKQYKKHGEVTSPALLNVCTRMAVAAVRTYPREEQQQVLIEFARLVSQRFQLAGITTPEEMKLILPH